MKVLFAVNSESVSDAIIKKYQKDYREILSYKNVYYFDAILKEIQKDKSYDRIVISVDLEPFSTNNYESIDKFLFEKLDGISDEAHDFSGREISIILICSDRHIKGSSFLVKLFGIGVYNALLGNDRSMEEVCRLINKPRTKKEAKMYYKIDTDDVNYRAESEDEVDEMQIQNILLHFRKLGKNTAKYAESFENIAAQYNEQQLKIIINCLPINVKRILETTSDKYQQIMAASGVMVQGVKSNVIDAQEDQKRTGIKIDIIENKMAQPKMNGPIVIPNSVKKTKSTTAKNVIAVPQAGSSEMQTAQQIQKNKKVEIMDKVEKNEENVELKPKEKVKVKIVRLPDGRIVKKRVVPKKKVDSITESQEQKVVKPERKSVVNKENVVEENDLPDLDNIQPVKKQVEQPKKRRGRPRKNPVEVEQETKPKGKRGRPRKVVKQELDEELEDIDQENLNLDIIDDLVNESDNEKMKKRSESPIDITENDDLDLSTLDDLDDLDDLDSVTEESFDEFGDYDEYGEYETSAEVGKKEKNIDELYKEDILDDDFEDDLSVDEDDLLLGIDDEDTDLYLEDIDDDDDDTEALLSDLDDIESDDDLDVSDDIELDDTEENFDESDMLLDDEEDLISSVDESEEEGDFLDFSADEIDESEIEVDDSSYDDNSLNSIAAPIDYSMSNLNSLMTKDKKIVTFIGSSKNGVSFLINNLAEIFASVGIDTAILDMTKNRNSYYIYTKNEEALRQIAYTSIEKLQSGVADGIKVKQNLTVYTSLPNDGKIYPNVEEILSTLVQNHSLVLVDCDFDTNPAYFGSSQEIYLVQSMDILTIQPLTAFLRDLKAQGAFEPEKVRVVVNKVLRIKDLAEKQIVAGISSYNDPAMSFMTELFNKDIVKYCSIPFDEIAYSKYLASMLNCKISLSGYPKNFINRLRMLGDMVYPLTSRQTYGSTQTSKMKQSGFSSSMNNTLNKMKKKKF